MTLLSSRFQLGAALALLATGFTGCSSDMAFKSFFSGDDTDESGPPGQDNDGDVRDPGSEGDDFIDRLPPSQTDVYVFVGNPDRNTVTRINARSLEVRTVPVGNNPQIVITTQDYTRAVAFNRGENSVSIIEAATLDVRTVPVRANLNRMTLSPDGAWAVLWFDPTAVRPGDPTPSGVQAFNESSFVNLVTGEHTPVAVDRNPRMVRFTPDNTRAVVVSDRSLALVDLLDATPPPATIIAMDPGVLDPPRAEEVLISPDGTWALVRQFGADALIVVDLLTLDVDRVPVGANPTNLELDPSQNRAAVVARDARELWLFDADDPYATPDVLAFPADLALGAIRFTPTGDQAIIYTTASLIPRYLSWDTKTDDLVLRALEKPVHALAITPSGEGMLVFHSRGNAPDSQPSDPLHDAWALSMVRLGDHLTDTWRLPGEPTGWANAASGDHGYFIMDGQPYLERVNFNTRFLDEIALRSAPVFVGVLPDLDPTDGDEPQAWVSQEHNLGRISFYDPDDDRLQTITGFELNSLIE